MRIRRILLSRAKGCHHNSFSQPLSALSVKFTREQEGGGPVKAILLSEVLALPYMALAVPTNAGPFGDAVAAYESGDFATALRLWRPLAEQGDSTAQHNLGIMYVNGLSVEQDYAQAYMWLSLAVAAGAGSARENRLEVAKRMTPDQFAEAQRMAREWMEKHQQ
jgi:TPR repeat protein